MSEQTKHCCPLCASEATRRIVKRAFVFDCPECVQFSVTDKAEGKLATQSSDRRKALSNEAASLGEGRILHIRLPSHEERLNNEGPISTEIIHIK